MANETTSIETTGESVGAIQSADVGISIEHLIARVDKIREVRAKVMQEGAHYGKIPGVSKASLLKPGAEILCMTFQLSPSFQLVEAKEGDHLEVVATCTLTHAPTGTICGVAPGSCSTRESKYAYRKGERLCPKCGAAAIIKGQEQYGGGWVCWKKKDGCGAKFSDGDDAIESQKTDRVENPDLPDQWNTVRKMACKRAHVAATLFATGASELFTQDVEDMAHGPDAEKSEPRAVRSSASPPTESEMATVVQIMRFAESMEKLNKVRADNRSRGWSTAQQRALNSAFSARKQELTSFYPAGGFADEADAERAAIQEES